MKKRLKAVEIDESTGISVERTVKPKGRRCKQCGRPLSIYNKRNTCYCHEYPLGKL